MGFITYQLIVAFLVEYGVYIIVDFQYVNQDLKTLTLSLPLKIKEERGRETKKREGVRERETKRRGEIERESTPVLHTVSLFIFLFLFFW